MELQKRIGIWDLDYYVGRRTLQCVGHVVRMDKSRLPERLLTVYIMIATADQSLGVMTVTADDDDEEYIIKGGKKGQAVKLPAVPSNLYRN